MTNERRVFVWLGILRNYDSNLRRDINSVSQGVESRWHRQEDRCKTELKTFDAHCYHVGIQL